MKQPHAIFVYGTLRRGYERQACWPRPPRSVQPVRVRGQLFDLGPYPALIPGDDWVVGERWVLAEADMDVTLAVLDDVEGFAGQADDLYRRVIIECHDDAGAVQPAYAYLYAAAEQLTADQRVRPNAEGTCRWEPAE